VPLTPEPGTTPEPEDKGDALEALLAAGMDHVVAVMHACLNISCPAQPLLMRVKCTS
jgi:hypothetical protein